MTSSYLTLHSPLDASVKRERKFDLQHLAGSESIGHDFSYRLNISSPERLSDQDMAALIGQAVTVHIGFKNEKEERDCRYINGIVYRLTELGISKAPLMPDLWRYEIEIGSWLRQLDLIQDCRIFQKNGSTSMSIISELLRVLGFRDFRNQADRNLPRKDYCVLYNESVLNFIQRLAIEDGILMRFDHSEKRHELVFYSDSSQSPKLSIRRFGPLDAMTRFSKQGHYLPVSDCQLASYHWESAPVKTLGSKTGIPHGRYRSFAYTGNYTDREDGENKAFRASRRLKGKMLEYAGESTLRALMAGVIFELNAPNLPDLHQKPFLLRSLEIEATPERYLNRFVALPAQQPYLPDFEDYPLLKKPTISGTQTALVVGEGAIQTDRFGRIKVRFHYDHYSAADSSRTSAYIRVAGPAAGHKRGFLFTPRVGEEVVVSYENGDPDKPLVIGSVYSPGNPPPHSPSNRPFTSLIKTDGVKDANQIVFDDEPGSENLRINAKKDMKIEVGHNLDIDVENDVTIRAKSVNIQVAKDITVKAGGSITNLSLATINSLAGVAITNTALGGILNLAGGIVKNTAGGMISNTAVLSVANTSALGIKQEAQGVIANTAAGAVLNTGTEVVNDGSLAVVNTSNLAIVNTASGNINNQAVLQKNKISGISDTEAESVSVKGITKVN